MEASGLVGSGTEIQIQSPLSQDFLIWTERSPVPVVPSPGLPHSLLCSTLQMGMPQLTGGNGGHWAVTPQGRPQRRNC